MRGFIDLHSHWVAGVDDGARTVEDGVALLAGLFGAGFSNVIATPHMRPGMFDNDAAGLRAAYERMFSALETASPPLPAVGLASEHFFDDINYRRLVSGEGLPYPGARAVLVEFPPHAFPASLPARLLDLRRRGLVPVIAHPERYQPVWKDDSCLDPLFDAGAALLLDVGALVGAYGRAAQRAAEKLLADEAYEAACSDAHKVSDVDVVVRAIARLESLTGADETRRLLRDAPLELLGPDVRGVHLPNRPHPAEKSIQIITAPPQGPDNEAAS